MTKNSLKIATFSLVDLLYRDILKFLVCLFCWELILKFHTNERRIYSTRYLLIVFKKTNVYLTCLYVKKRWSKNATLLEKFCDSMVQIHLGPLPIYFLKINMNQSAMVDLFPMKIFDKKFWEVACGWTIALL